MDDVFDSSFEKVTFFESETDSIFEKNFTDASKVNEYCLKVDTEYNSVINGGAAIGYKLNFIDINSVCLSDQDCVFAKGINIAQRLIKK